MLVDDLRPLSSLTSCTNKNMSTAETASLFLPADHKACVHAYEAILML